VELNKNQSALILEEIGSKMRIGTHMSDEGIKNQEESALLQDVLVAVLSERLSDEAFVNDLLDHADKMFGIKNEFGVSTNDAQDKLLN